MPPPVGTRAFALAFLMMVGAFGSACTKECISDLDCDRTEDGIEQVCSVDNRCELITPSELQGCANNAQCDDGAIGGTGICWDGVCRYRPTCLLFDGDVSVATDCGSGIEIETTSILSGPNGSCTSTFVSEHAGEVNVAVESLSAFEPEQAGGRILDMQSGEVVSLCEEGQYFVFESTGRFASCTGPEVCEIAFRPVAAGGLCDLDAPECDDDAFCAQINTVDSKIGACVKM